nr:GntR family transcriptional regulator [Isoptericola sediminis]
MYAQLVAQTHLAVARGDLAPGDRLPAARELATSLELNVHTVLRAYQQLRDEGLVDLRRSRGAVITAAAARDLTAVEDALRAFVAAAREARLSPEATTTLLQEELKR